MPLPLINISWLSEAEVVTLVLPLLSENPKAAELSLPVARKSTLKLIVTNILLVANLGVIVPVYGVAIYALLLVKIDPLVPVLCTTCITLPAGATKPALASAPDPQER